MDEKKHANKNIFLLLLLSFIITTMYSNIYTVSWHLDDKPNILNNHFLHIDSLDYRTLSKTLYTNLHNPYQLRDRMYRPVPCLTFALNWYFGKDNVLGYHIVDVIIHILTSFFLALFIKNLFQSPALTNYRKIDPILISFMASVLWASNPIQTQAVTYIVQRMAQLAAFFYIMGMYAYIKGRLSNSIYKRAVWFLLMFIIYPLAVYSKSNAAMLPIAILLVELIFFQNLSNIKNLKKIAIIALVSAGCIFFFATIVFFKGDIFTYLARAYEHRAFTLSERLLAEPRVVILYLTQIFFPTPDRFSIAHDIILSSSILKPWTTLPCIFLIAGMISFSIIQIKRCPLVAFALLFYFLNHIIESTILPLEIIFEHRNYLPSFFLFLPMTYALCKITMHFWNIKRSYSILSLFIMSCLIIGFSTSTFIRNKAWKNQISLWTDAIVKAPNNARAYNTLAIKLAWGNESGHPNRHDLALKLFETSLKKDIPTKVLKADILGNMASIYFSQKNERQKAIQLFEEAIDTAPKSRKIRRDFVSALIIMKNMVYAEEQVDILIGQNTQSAIYNNLKGFILLWGKEYSAAISYFKKAYKLSGAPPSEKLNILLNIGVSFSLSKKYETAERILLEAVTLAPKDITCHFALIENSLRAKKNQKTKSYVKDLFTHFQKKQIEYGIETFTDNPKYPPISKDKIKQAISFKN